MYKRERTEENKRPGPEPEILKLDDDWEQAVKKALRKKKPTSGWLKPEPRKVPKRD
jgi:hypothetical protein